MSRAWTDEEVETLRALYPTTSNAEIAEQLKRTSTSVLLKGRRLGLRKDAVRRKLAGAEAARHRFPRKGHAREEAQQGGDAPPLPRDSAGR